MSDEQGSRFRIGVWLFPLPLILYRAGEHAASAEDESGETCRCSPWPDPLDLLGPLLPKEVRRHVAAAQIELLKATRAVIDGQIERIERKKPPKRRAEKVPIEEDEPNPDHS